MGDPEVIRVTLLSLQVSLGATALSLASWNATGNRAGVESLSRA